MGKYADYFIQCMTRVPIYVHHLPCPNHKLIFNYRDLTTIFNKDH